MYIVLDIGLEETHFYTFVQSKCISIAPLNFSLSYSTGPTFGEALARCPSVFPNIFVNICSLPCVFDEQRCFLFLYFQSNLHVIILK